MEIKCMTVGLFQVNTYLVCHPSSGECVIVDTGEGDELAERISQMVPRPNIRAILLTHAHLDHAGGLSALQARLDIPTYLPEAELPLFETLPRQGDWFGMSALNRPCGRIDHTVTDGQVITLETFSVTFISTPGHSPGQGCYYTDREIFVGDTLFAGGIGRTDLPMGDPALMRDSLRRLMMLPGDLQVFPGHGPQTTLRRELESNPFLGYLRRERGMPQGTSFPW
ncbi:MAG: MBL fold metallo-hydrolase [Gammaproteobacteria bacterium]